MAASGDTTECSEKASGENAESTSEKVSELTGPAAVAAVGDAAPDPSRAPSGGADAGTGAVDDSGHSTGAGVVGGQAQVVVHASGADDSGGENGRADGSSDTGGECVPVVAEGHAAKAAATSSSGDADGGAAQAAAEGKVSEVASTSTGDAGGELARDVLEVDAAKATATSSRSDAGAAPAQAAEEGEASKAASEDRASQVADELAGDVVEGDPAKATATSSCSDADRGPAQAAADGEASKASSTSTGGASGELAPDAFESNAAKAAAASSPNNSDGDHAQVDAPAGGIAQGDQVAEATAPSGRTEAAVQGTANGDASCGESVPVAAEGAVATLLGAPPQVVVEGTAAKGAAAEGTATSTDSGAGNAPAPAADKAAEAAAASASATAEAATTSGDSSGDHKVAEAAAAPSAEAAEQAFAAEAATASADSSGDHKLAEAAAAPSARAAEQAAAAEVGGASEAMEKADGAAADVLQDTPGEGGEKAEGDDACVVVEEEEEEPEPVPPLVGAAERDAYVVHFRSLLEREREAEEAQVEERLRRPLQQLEAEGFACGGLEPHAGRDMAVSLTRPRGIPRLAEISIGRTVLLTSQGDTVRLADERTTAVAEVTNINPREISVQCGARLRGPLRLDLGPNSVTHRRLVDTLVALERACGPDPWAHGLGLVSPGTPLACALFSSLPIEEVPGDSENAGKVLESDVASLAKQPHFESPPPPWVRYPSGMYRAANERLAQHMQQPAPCRLNRPQARAVAVVVQERQQLTLLQGPPGTGKTTTSLEVICGWLRAKRGPILATAFSNKGVDNLAEGLWARGVSVLRLGSCSQDKPFSLDGHLRALSISKGMGKGVTRDVLGGAHVICATCVGAGMASLDAAQFPFVLVDEAAQVIEPATLLPLSKGSVQAVLVGDHCQLPATVLSREAENAGLGRSLFERMIGLGTEAHLLSVQYRMHPLIAAFPSWHFYKGKLRTGVAPAARPPMEAAYDLGSVAFVHVGASEAEGRGHSKMNQAEAQCVGHLVKGLKCAPAEVGVITPYSAQAAAIKRVLRPGSGEVHVASVDGFQGSEREAIILSLVRSNQEGNLGFVADWRRLNVAVTRARRLLVVVGNLQTVCRNNMWRDFVGLHPEMRTWEWRGQALQQLSPEAQELVRTAQAAVQKQGVVLPKPAWDTAAASAAPAPAAHLPAVESASAKTEAAARRQVEYYFSDENWPRDEELRSSADAEGYVNMTVILGFQRMKSLGVHTAEQVASLVRGSRTVVVSADGQKLRRSRPMFIPGKDVKAVSGRPEGPARNLAASPWTTPPLSASVEAAARKQIEYYFSDENWPKDEFLRSHADPEGFVELSVLLPFKRMKGLGVQTLEQIAQAIRGSPNLTLSTDARKVRRSAPPPAAVERPAKAPTRRSFYDTQKKPSEASHAEVAKAAALQRAAGLLSGRSPTAAVPPKPPCGVEEVQDARGAQDAAQGAQHAQAGAQAGAEAPAAPKELLQPWAAGLVEAAYLRCRKRKAVEAEDFDLAQATKAAEQQSLSRVASARRRALSAGARQGEWEELRRRKQEAVGREDYKLAAEMKRKQAELEESSSGLESLQERKRRAVEAEDYDLAAQLKREEQRLRGVESALLRAALEAAAGLAVERQLGGSLQASLQPPAGAAGEALWTAVATELRSQLAASTS